MRPPYSSGVRLQTSSVRVIISIVMLVSIGSYAVAAGSGSKDETPNIDGDPIHRALPPDRIPAIDDPEFVSADKASSFMKDDEPVLGFIDGDTPKAYSLWMLEAHEIVNDMAKRGPIAATW